MTTNSRIKLGNIIVEIAPVPEDIGAMAKGLLNQGYLNNDLYASLVSVQILIRASLRSVEGMKKTNGEPFKLIFNGNNVTEKSAADFLIELQRFPGLTQKFSYIIFECAEKVPFEFTDKTGAALEDVHLLYSPNQYLN